MKERIERLEAALTRLTELVEGSVTPVARGDHWLVDTVAERHPEGAVCYGGVLPDAPGPVRWQINRTASSLLAADWTEVSQTIDALSHPVRLTLVRLVLTGVTGTTELAEAASVATSGQLHHHLRQLVAAGWLTSTGRGHYAVPPRRIVPLLTIVSAASS